MSTLDDIFLSLFTTNDELYDFIVQLDYSRTSSLCNHLPATSVSRASFTRRAIEQIEAHGLDGDDLIEKLSSRFPERTDIIAAMKRRSAAIEQKYFRQFSLTNNRLARLINRERHVGAVCHELSNSIVSGIISSAPTQIRIPFFIIPCKDSDLPDLLVQRLLDHDGPINFPKLPKTPQGNWSEHRIDLPDRLHLPTFRQDLISLNARVPMELIRNRNAPLIIYSVLPISSFRRVNSFIIPWLEYCEIFIDNATNTRRKGANSVKSVLLFAQVMDQSKSFLLGTLLKKWKIKKLSYAVRNLPVNTEEPRRYAHPVPQEKLSDIDLSACLQWLERLKKLDVPQSIIESYTADVYKIFGSPSQRISMHEFMVSWNARKDNRR